jgi:RimJ/RimL family protein N-acetyltransferase
VEHWPLRQLVLRTPRLELRPDDDAGLDELAAVSYEGVHPPEEMPFGEPWTDADPRYLGRGTLQYFWSQRAALTPERWEVHFLVRSGGRVIGTQKLGARDFAITNDRSHGVSRRLGYRRDGAETVARRGRPVEHVRLVVTPSTLVRPEWTLEVTGYTEECRALLGGISRG